jgi:hypothetical protein
VRHAEREDRDPGGIEAPGVEDESRRPDRHDSLVELARPFRQLGVSGVHDLGAGGHAALHLEPVDRVEIHLKAVSRRVQRVERPGEQPALLLRHLADLEREERAMEVPADAIVGGGDEQHAGRLGQDLVEARDARAERVHVVTDHAVEPHVGDRRRGGLGTGVRMHAHRASTLRASSANTVK